MADSDLRAPDVLTRLDTDRAAMLAEHRFEPVDFPANLTRIAVIARKA